MAATERLARGHHMSNPGGYNRPSHPTFALGERKAFLGREGTGIGGIYSNRTGKNLRWGCRNPGEQVQYAMRWSRAGVPCAPTRRRGGTRVESSGSGGRSKRVWVDMGYIEVGEFISGGVGAVEHDGSDKKWKK